MALAAKKKKHQNLIRELTAKISKLEAVHKFSLVVRVATELADTRALLLEELFKRARKRLLLSQKLFYENRNKPGRLLARFTQNVHIVDNSGVSYSKNEEIALQFHNYYKSLYNIQSTEHNPTLAEEKSNMISNFLRKYSPSALTVENQQALDAPLSLDE